MSTSRRTRSLRVERLFELAELLPEALMLLDAQGRILAANREACALLGRTRESLEGGDLHALVTEPAERLDRYLVLCAGSRELLPGALTCRGPDGNPLPCRVHGAAVRPHTDGGPSYVLLRCQPRETDASQTRFAALNAQIEALGREITGRRRAEALLAGEKQILEMVAGGSALVSALDTLARIVESQTNGMLASVLLVEDTRLRHAAAPSLPAAYAEAIDGVAIGPSVGSCGTAAYRGERVIVEDLARDPLWRDFRDLALAHDLRACWSTPIRGGSARVLGTLALYYREPRVPTEDELTLIDNAAHVAGIAIERHQAQEALAHAFRAEQQARLDAEASSRAKDEFLAMLGHELRNPLGAIASAGHALELLGDSDTRRAGLQRAIVQQTDRLARLLDDLLDIGRVTAGKLVLQCEVLDLGDVARRVVGAAEPRAAAAGLVLTLTTRPAAVYGDPTRLEQVVGNLIDNALKYTPAGGRVIVSVGPDGEEVVLEVRDTGIGIAPEMLSRVFDLFSQAQQTIDRAAGGLGVGLTLAKRLTALHGGSIAVESAGLQRGSLFAVRLPCAKLAPAPAAEATDSAGPAPAPRRVLLVEDNEDAREALRTLLELWGHEVVEAADGRRALELARERLPEVALIDVGLPGIDGYEVARTLRRECECEGAHILLVALTGYGQREDRQRALDAGFDVHLVKPVKVETLTEVLESVGT